MSTNSQTRGLHTIEGTELLARTVLGSERQQSVSWGNMRKSSTCILSPLPSSRALPRETNSHEPAESEKEIGGGSNSNSKSTENASFSSLSTISVPQAESAAAAAAATAAAEAAVASASQSLQNLVAFDATDPEWDDDSDPDDDLDL